MAKENDPKFTMEEQKEPMELDPKRTDKLSDEELNGVAGGHNGYGWRVHCNTCNSDLRICYSRQAVEQTRSDHLNSNPGHQIESIHGRYT